MIVERDRLVIFSPVMCKCVGNEVKSSLVREIVESAVAVFFNISRSYSVTFSTIRSRTDNLSSPGFPPNSVALRIPLTKELDTTAMACFWTPPGPEVVLAAGVPRMSHNFVDKISKSRVNLAITSLSNEARFTTPPPSPLPFSMILVYVLLTRSIRRSAFQRRFHSKSLRFLGKKVYSTVICSIYQISWW